MKKQTRPLPKTGTIARKSGGSTSFRRPRPSADNKSTSTKQPTTADRTTTAKPAKKAPAHSMVAAAYKKRNQPEMPRSAQRGKLPLVKGANAPKREESAYKGTTQKKAATSIIADGKPASIPGHSTSEKFAKTKPSATKSFPAESRTTKPGRGKSGQKRTLHQSKKSAPPQRQSAAANTKISSVTVLRLNKFLADAGICSRRQADEYIQQGAVRVNGKIITEHGTKVHLSDLVTVKGEPVNAEKHLTYIVLNKPKDYITTTSDEKGRKTVMELIPLQQRVYPVGRLDRHTTGVLLLTNDGELAHRLMHPSYGVSRIYKAHLDKRLSVGDMRTIAKGVEIEDDEGHSYISGECNIALDPEDPRAVTLELAEGKNREVRRIFAALGYEVERLDRKGYAGISTRGLRRGEYRHLTSAEVRALEQLVKLDKRLEESTTARKGRTKTRQTQ